MDYLYTIFNRLIGINPVEKSKLPPRSFPFFDDRWKMEQLWKVFWNWSMIVCVCGMALIFSFFFSLSFLHKARKEKVCLYFLFEGHRLARWRHILSALPYYFH